MRITTMAIFFSILFFITGCSNLKHSEPKGEAKTLTEITNETIKTHEQVRLEPPIQREKETIDVKPSVPMESRSADKAEGIDSRKAKMQRAPEGMMITTVPAPQIYYPPPVQMNTESYTPMDESGFINAANTPLSTFSIDVDTASYSNIRRFVTGGSLPPVDAVRIEEMINYFSYHYPEPDAGPFSLTTEVGPSPWRSENKIIRIGLKAKNITKKDLPPSNLVFLIDVSGSMDQPNKLPLLKKSMKMLVDQLDGKDRVSMVVYAGADRIALHPTPGDRKNEINLAIDTLQAGGVTHGSKGIITAYELAERTRMSNGNNRVILASDGDFNVGITSRGELTRLIEEKRKSGIYLTVLGFGMGNYHDDTMETLADKGNGNYAYIDSLLEAKKVMVKEMSGTMFTLAKDLKIQVEFNPAKIGAYRLIGYENRALANEDFNNDQKDAGEIGVGHTVTALYELVPVGSKAIPGIDPLKYQHVGTQVELATSDELLTVKLRYKPLDKETSLLIEKAVKDQKVGLDNTSDDFRFATAVAVYGMWLKDSKHLHSFNTTDILNLARSSKGQDSEGYRAEFIRLVEMSELLKKK
jgi:Ca-activated chloride channel homolog